MVGALLVTSGLFVAARVADHMRIALAGALGQRLDLALRQRVIRATCGPAGTAHLEDAGTLDRIARARGLVSSDWHVGATVPAMANVATQWLIGFGSMTVLATFEWWLAALLFAAWAGTSHLFRREFLRQTQALSLQVAGLRRADYYRNLVLQGGAAKEVRLWGMLEWLLAQLDTSWRRVMHEVWDERRAGVRVFVLTALCFGVVQYAGFAVTGLATLRGEIDLAALAVFISAIHGLDLLSGLNGEALQLAYGTAAVPALLELEREVAPGRVGTAAGAVQSGALRHGIQLEGVRFRYPGQDHDVLAGLDLFVPAGRSLAVVGENGAGKTTLVKLLGRLYEPTAGRLVVDGVDLREVDAAAWQRRVAAVFQDYVQYKLSARDNVMFGAVDWARRLGSDEAEEAVRSAARRAGALEFVEALPAGWDTVLSREFAGGAELSGGQWQRLALARALFAVEAGACVLILDEPTANLDVRAEAALYGRFLDITRGLTTILISHRFSTVRQADLICVLAHGRVAELGTHEALLAAGGSYAEMFTLQASRFTAGEEHPSGELETASVF